METGHFMTLPKLIFWKTHDSLFLLDCFVDSCLQFLIPLSEASIPTAKNNAQSKESGI